MTQNSKGVRAKTRAYFTRFGTKRTVISDLKAGLVLGIESIPDGLAAGLLAGVNPLHGLYGYLAGTLGGALATGSVFMSVQATGALAVIVSDVPQIHSGDQSGQALATLAVMSGIIMLVLGIARLGSLVRFIPTAVLVGFVNAVAVSIVLGQLDNFSGYDSEGNNRVLKAIDTVMHVFDFNWSSVLVGTVTISLILLLERTRLGALGLVIAIILGSAVAALFSLLLGSTSVGLVSSIAEVPNSLPGLQLPDLQLVGALLIPALSLALVALVQGAAISGSTPNPGGEYPNISADFRGQGLANLLSGFFQGMPVGGSMSATSLVKAAGARSALANLTAGAVMATMILTLGGAIGYIALPALAGLLILVGIRTLKPHEILMVWRTGPIQATVFTVTFVLTMTIPLQYAVLTGVGLSVVLFVARQSNRIVVRQWNFEPGNPLPTETKPLAELASRTTVVLAPYGSLFFAAAPIFEKQLPKVPSHCERTTVILRLRGKEQLGSTFIKTLELYSRKLAAAGGALVIVGVSAKVYEQLRATKALKTIGTDRVVLAEPRVGDSLSQAMQRAHEWSTEGAD